MNFFWRGRRAGLPLLLAASALAASGCGPGKGSITGVVKYNGEPLPSGDITFMSQAGDKEVLHADIVDGKYSIPKIEAGLAKITVTTTPPTTPGAAPSGATAPPPVAPGKYVPINPKYANADTSGLTYEVKPGAQPKDFDLPP